MTNMATYKIHEAKAHFSELIEKAMLGEEVIIARGNQPVVRLMPMRKKAPRRVGSAKGAIQVAPDFEAPLADFEDYS